MEINSAIQRDERIFKIKKVKINKLFSFLYDYEGCGRRFSQNYRLQVHYRTHVLYKIIKNDRQVSFLIDVMNAKNHLMKSAI